MCSVRRECVKECLRPSHLLVNLTSSSLPHSSPGVAQIKLSFPPHPHSLSPHAPLTHSLSHHIHVFSLYPTLPSFTLSLSFSLVMSALFLSIVILSIKSTFHISSLYPSLAFLFYSSLLLPLPPLSAYSCYLCSPSFLFNHHHPGHSR